MKAVNLGDNKVLTPQRLGYSEEIVSFKVDDKIKVGASFEVSQDQLDDYSRQVAEDQLLASYAAQDEAKRQAKIEQAKADQDAQDRKQKALDDEKARIKAEDDARQAEWLANQGQPVVNKEE